MSDFSIRAARPGDAADIAVLTDIAGEGVPARTWLGSAGEGESSLGLARSRALREDSVFSYRNAWLAEKEGAVAGLLLGYPITGGTTVKDVPAVFRPLVELENEVPGYWYVNILAVYPEHRRMGIAGALLGLADRMGREARTAGMALIVASANGTARRLYERSGYRERSRRPAVLIHGGPTSTEMILLTKPHG